MTQGALVNRQFNGASGAVFLLWKRPRRIRVFNRPPDVGGSRRVVGQSHCGGFHLCRCHPEHAEYRVPRPIPQGAIDVVAHRKRPKSDHGLHERRVAHLGEDGVSPASGGENDKKRQESESHVKRGLLSGIHDCRILHPSPPNRLRGSHLGATRWYCHCLCSQTYYLHLQSPVSSLHQP